MSEAAPGAQSPSPTESAPAPSPPTGESTPSPNNPAAAAPKGFVPNAALNAERQRRQQAAQVAQTAQQQLQQAQAEIAALKVAREAPAAPQADPYRERLIQTLGTDEAGEKALQMFDAHGEVIRAEMAGQIPTAEDIQRMASEQAAAIVDQRMGQHTAQEAAMMAVAQRLNGWVNKGVVSPEQAVQFRQEFDNRSAGSPHVLQNAVNAEAVLSMILTEAVEGNTLSAFTPKTPEPLQTAASLSSGPAPGPAEQPEVTNPSQHVMPSMRGQTSEAIRRIREQSIARHTAAQGN